ncbi:hypothetical protein A2U01_0081822, partial [Trifolium medium]|nr:hypothetical protein [Trifolium medium]
PLGDLPLVRSALKWFTF